MTDRYPLPPLETPPAEDVSGLVAGAAQAAIEDRINGVDGTIATLERHRVDLVEQLTKLDDRLLANYHERIRLGIWLDESR